MQVPWVKFESEAALQLMLVKLRNNKNTWMYFYYYT